MIRVERVTHSYHVGAQPVAVLKDVDLRIGKGTGFVSNPLHPLEKI